MRPGGGTLTASRGIAHRSARGVGSATRTGGDIAGGIQFDIALDAGQLVRIGGSLSCLQGPGLGGAVNLAQIIDAGVLLGSCAGADEVWNRHGQQQPDYGDDNHYFNQREAGFPYLDLFHTNSLSF
jgi:hypothetical protein